ncbi:tyrosine-type recombinase/integrase [Mesorhizobium vachelliae]|uniref:tyrosine-type recombinase/integrase n=1 Tax=Mesorhizobium vachelliae TaxID=3072309 RepID=UPI003D319C03
MSYLQLVRPRCRRREVFLTLKAPFRPLSASAVYHVVASRLSALGVQSMHFGPHGLRHACVTHLVAQGLRLKEIGDHLGHRSAFATGTYARVDLAGCARSGRSIWEDWHDPFRNYRQLCLSPASTRNALPHGGAHAQVVLSLVGDRPLPEVTADRVLAFLAGRGAVTRFWERKHSVLAGFYRFAIARGHTNIWPLPRAVPKPTEAFVPYITPARTRCRRPDRPSSLSY